MNEILKSTVFPSRVIICSFFFGILTWVRRIIRLELEVFDNTII